MPAYLPIILVFVLGFIAFIKTSKEDNPNRINWSPLESVGASLFIYGASQLFLGLIVAIIAAVTGRTDQIVNWFSDNNYGNFVSVLVVEFFTMVLIISFLKRRRSTMHAIGLNRAPVLNDIIRAAIAFVGYIAIYIVSINIIEKLIPSINIDQKQELGFSQPYGIQLLAVYVSLAVLPPIVEEITARGLLYSGLKNRLPVVKAAIITSLLFGAAHLQAGGNAPLLWVAGIDTFILSLFLVYLREKTNSLWSPIFLHAIKNNIAFFSLYVWHFAKL